MHAETFYLTNGKQTRGRLKIVGEIISEKDGVTEVKENLDGALFFYKFKAAEIEKTTREDFEELYYKELLVLKVTPDLKEVEWYEEQHKELLKRFFDEFPKSKNIAEVRAIEKALNAEMAVIKEGGIKIGGKMISAGERRAAAYDIDSQIEASKFHAFVEKAAYGEAIAIEEKMFVDYPKSKAYAGVLKSLPMMVKSHRQLLDYRRKEFERRVKKLAKVKEEYDEEQYNKVLASRKKQKAEFEAIIKKEVEAGVKWLTINPHSMESIDAQAKQMDAYMQIVDKKIASHIDLDVGSIYTEAWKLVEAKKFKEAKKLIEKLSGYGMNIGYWSTLDEFFEEERDKANDEAERELRGTDADIIDLYMDIDERVQDTLVEAAEYAVSVKDEVTAKECRARLKVFTSRLQRLFKRRQGLEKMDPRDMESQNAELAIVIEPLLEKYNVLAKQLATNKEFLLLLEEPMNAFGKVLPNPDDYLTENAKKMIQDFADKEKLASMFEEAIPDFATKYAYRKPMSPVLVDKDLNAIKQTLVDLESWSKIETHCPNNVYIEYKVNAHWIYNFHKGDKYTELSFSEQVAKNAAALKASRETLDGMTVFEIITEGKKMLMKNPWVGDAKKLTMKQPSSEGEANTLSVAIPDSHTGAIEVIFRDGDTDVPLKLNAFKQRPWGKLVLKVEEGELRAYHTSELIAKAGGDLEVLLAKEVSAFTVVDGVSQTEIGSVKLKGGADVKLYMKLAK